MRLARSVVFSSIPGRGSRFLSGEENTPVSLDAVGEVGNAWECGGVGEGVGGKGELGAAGVGGDDSFLSSSEEGTGEPGGRIAGVVFSCGYDGGDVAGWIAILLLILLAIKQGRSRRRVDANRLLFMLI